MNTSNKEELSLTETLIPRLAEAIEMCVCEDEVFRQTYTREQCTRAALLTAISVMREAAAQLTTLAQARDDERVKRLIEQASVIDAKVRLKYQGQIQELTERAEAAEAQVAAQARGEDARQ